VGTGGSSLTGLRSRGLGGGGVNHAECAFQFLAVRDLSYTECRGQSRVQSHENLSPVSVEGNRRAVEAAAEPINPDAGPLALTAAHGATPPKVVYTRSLETNPPPRPVNRTSTIQELADEFVRRHVRAPYLRPSSIRSAHSLLRRIILPALRSLKVQDVGQRHVEDLRDSWSGTRIRRTALWLCSPRCFIWPSSGTLRRTRTVPRYGTPVATSRSSKSSKCERWLRRDEIKRLITALRRHPDQDQANAVRLILLTGCRKTEALTATWSEFDLEERLWSKPSHHTKNRRVHHAALSSEACLLLRRMKRSARGPYLFPGRPGVRDTRGDLYQFWDESGARRASKQSGCTICATPLRPQSSLPASPSSWSASSWVTATSAARRAIHTWRARRSARRAIVSGRSTAKLAAADGHGGPELLADFHSRGLSAMNLPNCRPHSGAICATSSYSSDLAR